MFISDTEVAVAWPQEGPCNLVGPFHVVVVLLFLYVFIFVFWSLLFYIII